MTLDIRMTMAMLSLPPTALSSMAHYIPLPYFRPRVQCIVGFRSCEMRPELRSCVRVEAAVLASPPLPPVPSSPYGLCGRKAALEEEEHGG